MRPPPLLREPHHSDLGRVVASFRDPFKNCRASGRDRSVLQTLFEHWKDAFHCVTTNTLKPSEGRLRALNEAIRIEQQAIEQPPICVPVPTQIASHDTDRIGKWASKNASAHKLK